MPEARPGAACLACGGPVARASLFSIPADLCGRCGGAFLGAGRGLAPAHELATLFAVGPRDVAGGGPSRRVCPNDRLVMRLHRVVAHGLTYELERCGGCGAIYLDAHEARDLAAAVRRGAEFATAVEAAVARVPSAALEVLEGVTGAEFDAPPDAEPAARGGPSAGPYRDGSEEARGLCAGMLAAELGAVPSAERRLAPRARGRSPFACPRCSAALDLSSLDRAETHSCATCGGAFVRASELETKIVRTEALFRVRAEAVTRLGEADLACPACGAGMERLRVATLQGFVDVDRAPCCGGLFFDPREAEAFIAAARRALRDVADAAFVEAGEVVGEAAVARELVAPAREAAERAVREAVDAQVLEQRVAAEVRRRVRARRGRPLFGRR